MVNYIDLKQEHLDVVKQIEMDLINKKNLNNKNELKKLVLSKNLNYNKLTQTNIHVMNLNKRWQHKYHILLTLLNGNFEMLLK